MLQNAIMTISKTAVQIAADNLARLMHARQELGTLEKLEPKAGVGKSTIGRLKNGDVSVGVATLEGVARAFKLEPWQMLVENLDPLAPPILRTSEIALSEAERKLIDLYRASPMAHGFIESALKANVSLVPVADTRLGGDEQKYSARLSAVDKR